MGMSIQRKLRRVFVLVAVVGTIQAQSIWSGVTDTAFTTATNWSGTFLNDGTVDVSFGATVSPVPVITTNTSIKTLTYSSGAPSFTLANSGGATLTIAN